MLAYMCCAVMNVECESKLEGYVRTETFKLLVLKFLSI